MQYEKACKICGKPFITNHVNYVTCSPECGKENGRRLNIEYRKDPHFNEKRNLKYRNKRLLNSTIVPCKICGEPVPPTHGPTGQLARKHYHIECIKRDMIQAIKEGTNNKDPRMVRAKNTYDLSVKDLLLELLECVDVEKFNEMLKK